MKAFLIIFAAYALLAVLILRWMELASQNRPKFGTKPTGVTLEEVAESYKNANDHSAFQIGQTVEHQGEARTVYDVDEGYGMLALDGDRYIAPSHPDNSCIEAPMGECKILS